MSLRGPGGPPPPSVVHIAGSATRLAPLADTICGRYRVEFPDEQERYGDAGVEWCRHDNQWLLSWAVNDVLGVTDIGEQVSWLARVLHARHFPVSRLARDLEIAAEVVGEGVFGDLSTAVAQRLLTAADTVSGLDLTAAGANADHT